MGTRADLISSVLDDIDRPELTDKAVRWVRYAEARFNEVLRVRDMLTRAVLPVTGPRFRLPDNYIAMEEVGVNRDVIGGQLQAGISRGDMLYASPSQIREMASEARWHTLPYPGIYTVHGKEIELAPWRASAIGFQIELLYFRKIPALATDDSTNWLLEGYEELYANCVKIFGHRHLLENDRANEYETIIAGQIQIMNDRYQGEKFGSAQLVARPARKLGGRHS